MNYVPSYFIGIPTDNQFGHMTLKYLGRVSDYDVEVWKRKMDSLTQVERFPLQTRGMGLLGRQNTYMVDFLKVNPRMERALGTLDNTVTTQVPHVTKFTWNREANTGPVDPMDTVIADTINMYKSKPNGGGWDVVYSVRLKKRSGLTWIKDALGLSKYAEKNASLIDVLAYPGKKIGWWIHKPKIERFIQGAMEEAKRVFPRRVDDAERRAYFATLVRNKKDVYAEMRKKDNMVGHMAVGGGLMFGGTLGYNLMNKKASRAGLIEAGIGGVVGSGIGALADSDKRWRGALIGGTVGAVGSRGVGKHLRNEQVRLADEISRSTSGTISRNDQYARQRLHGMLDNQRLTPPDSIGFGQFHTLGHKETLNTMLATPDLRNTLAQAVQETTDKINRSPFGIGRKERLQTLTNKAYSLEFPYSAQSANNAMPNVYDDFRRSDIRRILDFQHSAESSGGRVFSNDERIDNMLKDMRAFKNIKPEELKPQLLKGASLAHVVEAGVGGVVGGLVGRRMNAEDPKRGMLIGAGAGIVGGLGVGTAGRFYQGRRLKSALGRMKDTQNAMIDTSTNRLNSAIQSGKPVKLDEHMDDVNNLLVSKHQRAEILGAHDAAKGAIHSSPFGLGGGRIVRGFEDYSKPYTLPYAQGPRKMEEDVRNLGFFEKRRLKAALNTNKRGLIVNTPEPSSDVIAKILENYQK